MKRISREDVREIRRAAAVRAFVLHLLLFGGAVALGLATGLDWDYFWLFAGWTIGVALHAVTAAVSAFFLFGPRDEERIGEVEPAR